MVHKNYKWNISKEKGEEIVISTIKDILSGSKDLTVEYDELLFALNHRTKGIIIKNNNKVKSISNFIKNVFGGLTYYIECNPDFILSRDNGKVYIRLLHDIAGEYSDWILVNDDCY